MFILRLIRLCNIYPHCIRFFIFDVMNLLKLRKISGAGSILKATLIIRQKTFAKTS